jgi:hypothetical protein
LVQKLVLEVAIVVLEWVGSLVAPPSIDIGGASLTLTGMSNLGNTSSSTTTPEKGRRFRQRIPATFPGRTVPIMQMLAVTTRFLSIPALLKSCVYGHEQVGDYSKTCLERILLTICQ